MAAKIIYDAYDLMLSDKEAFSQRINFIRKIIVAVAKKQATQALSYRLLRMEGSNPELTKLKQQSDYKDPLKNYTRVEQYNSDKPHWKPEQGTKIILYLKDHVKEFNAAEDTQEGFLYTHILLGTAKDLGRGIDYKNVRRLIKFGFFKNDENQQLDGRVNRIRSITHKGFIEPSRTIPDEAFEHAKKVSVAFYLPHLTSDDSSIHNRPALTVHVEDYKIDRINCYYAAYKTLQLFVLEYSKMMLSFKRLSIVPTPQTDAQKLDYSDHRKRTRLHDPRARQHDQPPLHEHIAQMNLKSPSEPGSSTDQPQHAAPAQTAAQTAAPDSEGARKSRSFGFGTKFSRKSAVIS